jgi:Domain of unknown function (DUF4150)
MADNVFVNGRAAIHAGSAGKSIAFPDVWLCPPPPPSGPIPTPLPNTAQAKDLQGGAATVTIEGNRVAHAKSFIGKSTGNEVAKNTGGGIITHVVQGAAHFQTFSMNVFVENEPMVRHGDLVTHNHLGETPGNTGPTPWMSTMLAGPGPAPKESEKQVGNKKDWIKLKVVDQDNHPVSGASYRVTTPEGKEVTGRLFRGGAITLRGIDKGSCTVEFKTTPAVTGQAKGKNAEAQPYKDTPMKLATGKEHLVQVTIPRVLCVHMPIDPTDKQFAKHRFILRSKDGSYEAKRTVADNAVPRRRQLTLEFEDLLPGKIYTLFHDHGDGTMGSFFTDQSYEDLFPDTSTNKPRRPKETLIDAPSAKTARPLFGVYRDDDDVLMAGELTGTLVSDPE